MTYMQLHVLNKMFNKL